MNRNVLIVLAGGILVAVLVAMLVQASLKGSRKDAVKVEQEPRVNVVVAAKPIKMGEKLTAENLRYQAWPKAAVFTGAVIQNAKDKKPIDMISGSVRRSLAEGEPVLQTALVPPGANYMAAALSDGMRAVSIPIASASAVAGFVGAGDYVDITLTYSYNMDTPEGGSNAANVVRENLDRYVTETIMQNVKVLAIDQSMSKPEKMKVGRTATLEVTLKQAETLYMARKVGTLGLVLRKLGDETVMSTEERWPLTTDERLLTISEDLETKIGPSQNTNYVRVYTGGTMQSVAIVP